MDAEQLAEMDKRARGFENMVKAALFAEHFQNAHESLKTTLDRVAPYWAEEISPKLTAGRNVLVAAHGNSLRAVVKLLFNVGEAEIVDVEIPTGNPLVIELDGAGKPVSARYLDAARATAIPSVPAG